MVVAVSLGFFRNAAPGDMMNLCAGVEGTPIPPTRGHKLMGTRPLVHVGFMKSWLAGGFNLKVINRIMQLVNSRKAGADKLKILVTGETHSCCM